MLGRAFVSMAYVSSGVFFSKKKLANVTGVFEPMILNQIEEELKRADICISTDASNRKAIKIFCFVAILFAGKIRLVELKSLPGERAQQIINFLEFT